MPRPQLTAILLLTLALLPAGAPRAQSRSRETPGMLEGTVLSESGAPVAGARILWQTADGKRPHALRVDRRGQFLIGRLQPGIYQLRAVTKKASSEWATNVVVRPGRRTQVTLRLESPAPPAEGPAGGPTATPARPKATPVAN